MTKIFLLYCSIIFVSFNALAQVPPGAVLQSTFLEDINGDGQIEVLAFGDSITRGVGDFNPFGSLVDEEEASSVPFGEAGFPLRLETFLGIGVSNQGLPGELINGDGIGRFARVISSERPDYAIILTGSNDAFTGTRSGQIFFSYQALVNIARANGVEPILVTPTPTCCDRASLNPFLTTYAAEARSVGDINGISIVDANRAFRNGCPALGSCPLLNRREGLHPNQGGYDVIGEVILATLLNIDIFSGNGAGDLASRLGLPEESVLTQPDV